MTTEAGMYACLFILFFCMTHIHKLAWKESVEPGMAAAHVLATEHSSRAKDF